MNRKKILLGHLNSMGDCLFATVIARQIKEINYPGCHLTWAVNDKCRQAIMLNPYVDDIWEVATKNNLTTNEEWNAFVSEAKNREKRGDFDLVFLTQIIGDNWSNYDGGIRSSIYNNYPRKISVPHQPVVRLSETEIENVRRFAEKYELEKYRQVVLIECRPVSFAVALNPQTAYDLALEITAAHRDIAVILSSNKPLASSQIGIIDASELSFRENAELTKYCALFIGCGSGISWLTTSDWAKKLNTILVINEQQDVLASMIYDREYLNLPTDHIIEIKSNQDSIKKLKNCFNRIMTEGFASARASFNETIKLTNYGYLRWQVKLMLARLEFGKFFSFLGKSVRRNGLRPVLSAQFTKIASSASAGKNTGIKVEAD